MKKINVSISLNLIKRLEKKIYQCIDVKTIALTALLLALAATLFSFTKDYIALYGDAESHLNIAKRVVHSITPGFAQIGGIWLPLPHLLMIPFVYFDSLWRTGL